MLAGIFDVPCTARTCRSNSFVCFSAITTNIIILRGFRPALFVPYRMMVTRPVDLLSCDFTSHSTQNTSFRSQSFGSVWGKTKQLKQKKAFTNQKKCTTTQNKHKKTKARFSRLLRQPARKRSGSILKGKDK